MKKLFLLLFVPIVWISGHSQKPVSDKYVYIHGNYRGGHRSGKFPVRDYKLPSSCLSSDYKIIELKNEYAYAGMENDWYGNGGVKVKGVPKNGYFFLDDNPFRDNSMLTIIQSSNYDNNIIPDGNRSGGFMVPYLSFCFTKSDISPLKLWISGNNIPEIYKNDHISTELKIELIFDGNPSTLITIDNYIEGKEIDPKSKIISNLKKYSFVDVKITKFTPERKGWEGTKIVTKESISNSKFTKVSLRGSTSALNKICSTSLKPSRKNQFDYIYSMGMANFNPFDYEGYIYKFLEDAKKNHGLNFDYVKNRTLYTISKNLDDGVIAQSLTSDDDASVVIQIDPQNWQKASQAKRWYIIYHELGHDILNLDHGECGPMMNAYAKSDYSWSEFEKDKASMFNSYKSLKGN